MKKVLLPVLMLVMAFAAIAANAAEAPTYGLTSEGVGPVKMNMLIKDLPKSVEGLYDAFTISEDMDGHLLVFTLNGEKVMEARARYDRWDVGNDETLAIYLIKVSSKSVVGIDIKGKLYGVGDNIKTLITNKSVKRVDANRYTYKDVVIDVTNSNGASTIKSIEFELKEEEVEWP